VNNTKKIVTDKYYGKNVVVIDSISDGNIREMNDFSDHGRDVEVFTTTKKENCGCTQEWTNTYEEIAERFWTHSYNRVKCKAHN